MGFRRVGCVRIVNILVNVLINILIVTVYVVSMLKVSLNLPTIIITDIISVGGIDRLLTPIHINVAPVNKLYLITITPPVHHDIVQFDIPVPYVKVRQVP